jgi:hypothetical protein
MFIYLCANLLWGSYELKHLDNFKRSFPECLLMACLQLGLLRQHWMYPPGKQTARMFSEKLLCAVAGMIRHDSSQSWIADIGILLNWLEFRNSKRPILWLNNASSLCEVGYLRQAGVSQKVRFHSAKCMQAEHISLDSRQWFLAK